MILDGRLRGMVAAIAAITSVGVAATLTLPLLAVLMERQGVGAAAIGVNTALASVGVIAAGPALGPVLSRRGAPRVMLACVALAALCLVGFAVGYDYWAWCALRLGLGLASGGLFLASEYWVLAAAPTASRGRWIAVYALTLSLGFALGPAALRLLGVDGWPPFLFALGALGVAAAAIVVAWRDAPKISQEPVAPVLRYLSTDTALVVGAALFGALEFGAFGLAPIWALRAGFSETDGVDFAIALAAGGFVMTPIIGWLADRLPARALLVGAAMITVGAACLLPAIGATKPLVLVLLAFWGGSAAALYIVALVAMGARYAGQPARMAGGNAAIVSAYGAGALVGPPLIGAAMQIFGANGFPASFGALAAAYIVTAVIRGLIRPRASS